jgi:hypothetical protein
MKTAAPARKVTGPKNSRWGQKLTRSQKAKLEAIFDEVDEVFGGRDTGTVNLLIKLRRGEA